MIQDSVDIHFSALGAIDDTQTIPLGDYAVYMTGPAGGG